MDTASKPNESRHFLSFSRKLFLSVILLFLLFAGSVITYQYQREKEYKIELLDLQLQDYNEDLHYRLQETPDSLWSSMLGGYISHTSIKDLRVTVISPKGIVLYDSSKGSEKVDNHHNRPEVLQALRHGKGHDVRRTSETTGIPYFTRPPTSAPTSSARPCPTALTSSTTCPPTATTCGSPCW